MTVYREAEVTLYKSLHSICVKLGIQKGKEKIQDNLDISEFENSSFDFETCASCKHRFVVSVD